MDTKIAYDFCKNNILRIKINITLENIVDVTLVTLNYDTVRSKQIRKETLSRQGAFLKQGIEVKHYLDFTMLLS